MPYVVIQENGAFEPLEDWWWYVDLTATPAFELDDAWERVCSRMAENATAIGRTGRFNAILIFDAEEFLISRDGPALERLIAITRIRTWGARLLLVLRSVSWLAGISRSSYANIREWLNEVLAGKVSDVIQISERIDWKNPATFWASLRDSISGIKDRQTILKAVAAGGRSWRCALPEDRDSVAAAIGADLTITNPREHLDCDVVIVLKESATASDSIEEINRFLDGSDPDRPRRCIVVSYAPALPAALSDYCANRGLRPPITISGDFELWYFLLRLNENARAKVVDRTNSVRMVLAPEPRIRITDPGPEPSVLFTSVFANDQTGQLLESSEDVGELLQRAPAEMHYRVELGVDPRRLTEVLEQIDPPNVWIHMGHGRGIDGLEVLEGRTVDAEKWIRCFLKRDLRLALFLVCHSDDIARQFAREGSVGIGFDGKVGSDEGRHVAIEVLKSIVAHGTREEAILAGFRAGVARYESIQTQPARARAYYPRRT